MSSTTPSREEALEAVENCKREAGHAASQREAYGASSPTVNEDGSLGPAHGIGSAALSAPLTAEQPLEKMRRCSLGCHDYGQCKANMHGVPSECRGLSAGGEQEGRNG